jgi:hypothetical protein
MRLPFATLVLLLCAVSPSVAAAVSVQLPSTATSFSSATTLSIDAHPLTPQNAPADEYFGRLKLSNLGVRNIIHAMAVEGNSPLALPLQRTRIMGVHTAIVEWGDAFPRDPWLRRVVLNFTDLLAQKHDVETDAIAIDLLLQASHRFRDTAYERMALSRANALAPTSTVDWTIVPYQPTYADSLELHVGRL